MKAHKPDRRTLDLVSALALNGVVQSRIAEHVGISEPCLRKHYRATLDLATESVCARVAKNLVRIASTGSGNAAVQAAKYVLGCRAGWKDTTHVEIDPSERAMACFVGEADARQIIADRLAQLATRNLEIIECGGRIQ
jgi:hypothetical protein